MRQIEFDFVERRSTLAASLHNLTAYVMLKSDVDLLAKINDVDKLTAKEKRVAQRLCRSAFLDPGSSRSGYVLAVGGRLVVDAYRAAGWLP